MSVAGARDEKAQYDAIALRNEALERENVVLATRLLDLRTRISELRKQRRLLLEDLSKFKESDFDTSSDEEALDEGDLIPGHPAGSDATGATHGSRKRKGASIKGEDNAPKRARNSFMIFVAEQRQAVQAQHPELTNQQISKVLGEKWKALSDAEKEPYRARAQEERAQLMSKALPMQAPTSL
mmetsp:Transcript_1758/g.5219  ORF Transcript_1758/g.5219 Transcript_1758/m.5219 type:complete len:183 (-) Transcript_1758:147-695(-)